MWYVDALHFSQQNNTGCFFRKPAKMNNHKKSGVLAIYGSPRQGGNSEVLLDKMLEGALTHDVEVERIYVSKLNINPCRECHGCDEDGRCVVADDMDTVYPKLMSADYLIFASPIFFYNVPSQAKALIDRTQAKWVEKYILKKPGRVENTRPGFFILVAGTKGEKIFTGAEFTMKYFFDAVDFHIAGKLEFRGIDAKGEIFQHPDCLEQAYRAGIDFIRK